MASGWGHALAAAVGGYMAGEKLVRGREEYDENKKLKAEDREYLKLQREREAKAQTEADELRGNLRAAAQPIAMTEGAGGMVRPETMDNRDVGLPENEAQPNAGLMPVAYRVGAQGYEDRGVAQAAVAQQNSPQAMQQRVMAAYQGAGMPEKAMEVQSKANASEMQGMQLSDARWRRELGSAMHLGHAGLAQFATKSEAGPMAGMNVALIPSADGKTVQYGVAGADGALSPIPGLPAFSNDERGVGQAAWMLDKTITPEMRMAFYQGQDERQDKRVERQETRAAQAATAARTQANSDRDYNLRVSTQGAVADRAAEANRLKAEENSIKRGEKIPENSTALRKEFEALPEVKNYKQALPSYKGIEDAVKRNTPMSDINIVYGIAKLYDPTSVVREGEYATVANAPAIPERVKGWVQYVAGGGKLTEQVKQQILTEATSRMGTFETEFGKARTTYQDIAKRSNADPSLVISSDYKPAVTTSGAAPPPGRAQAPAAGARVAGEGGKSYVFKGGDPKDRANWELAK